MKNLSWKRIVLYLCGLAVYAFGASLMARVNLGISPLTSVAYIFTRFTPLTLGMTQLIFNVFLVGVQAVWMGREFKPVEYLQVLVTIVFSLLIDLSMAATVALSSPDTSYLLRWLLFGASLVAMAIGITAIKISDLVMLPGDGVPKVMAYKRGWVFGKAKVVSDSICAVATCVISLLALGRIEAIGPGTVIAALALGNLARIFIRFAQPPLEKILNAPRTAHSS